MEYLTLILAFIGGVFTGGIAMGIVGAAAYEQGVKDERRLSAEGDIPPDVKRYLNDLNLDEEL